MKRVKIFDFDGTLFSKNSISILVQAKYYSCSIVRFGLWFLLMLIKAPIFVFLYKKCSIKFNRYLYKHYRGFRLDYLEHFAKNQGFEFIRDHIFIEGLEAINGAEKVVIISAGLDIILKPFCSKLGIESDCVFANSLVFKDGICTGKVKGAIVDNLEKAKCVEKIKNIYPGAQLSIFGNSRYDYPMLKLADRAFCINPNPKLINFFQNHSINITHLYWKKLFFKSNFLHTLLGKKIIGRFFCDQIIGTKINDHGSIIISNHQSFIDHYLTASIVEKSNFCFISKKEHFQSKFGNFYCSLTRAIPIDRNSPLKSMKSLFIAKYALLLGINIIIYPEGTRSIDKEMNHFKKGFLKLASLLPEVKIIPITISNSYKILRKGAKIPNLFQKAQVTIHSTISLKRGFDEDQILEQCFNTVKSGLR